MIRTALVVLALLSGSLLAQEKPRPAKHLLRYSFRAGDEDRFQVREDLAYGREANKLEHRTTMIRDMHWKVVATDGTWSVMEVRLERLRIRQPGVKGTNYDSAKTPKKAVPKAWAYLEIDKPLRYRVDPRGQLRVPDLEDPKRKDLVLFDLRAMVRQLPELPVSAGSKWSTKIESRIWNQKHQKVTVANRLDGVKKAKVSLSYEMELPDQGEGFKVETLESEGQVVFDLARLVPDRVDQTVRFRVSGRWIATYFQEKRFRIGPPGSLEEDVPVVGGGK